MEGLCYAKHFTDTDTEKMQVKPILSLVDLFHGTQKPRNLSVCSSQGASLFTNLETNFICFFFAC